MLIFAPLPPPHPGSPHTYYLLVCVAVPRLLVTTLASWWLFAWRRSLSPRPSTSLSPPPRFRLAPCLLHAHQRGARVHHGRQCSAARGVLAPLDPALLCCRRTSATHLYSHPTVTRSQQAREAREKSAWSQGRALWAPSKTQLLATMRQQKGHHRHAAAPRRCSCCAAGQSHHRRRAASSTLRAGQVAWQCAALAALVATACARQLLAAAARDPGGLAPHGLAHGIRLRSSTGSTQPSSAASASAASVSGLGALDVDDLGGEQEAAEPWWDSSAGAPGGGRALAEAMPPGPPCPSLSKELLYRLAKQNTVLVMCIDRLLLRRFARSWVRNVQRANITYWVVAAMDPWSSKALGTMGVRQCFNSPPPKNATVNFHSDGQGRQGQEPQADCQALTAALLSSLPLCRRALGRTAAAHWARTAGE